MNPDRAVLDGITDRIIGCAFTVANGLGIGFSEKCYENALAHEMLKQGLAVLQQIGVTVWFDTVVIGEYVADLMVENEVMVELKVAKALGDQHVAQCTNYLRAADKRLCLLINFGTPKPQIRRVSR